MVTKKNPNLELTETDFLVGTYLRHEALHKSGTILNMRQFPKIVEYNDGRLSLITHFIAQFPFSSHRLISPSVSVACNKTVKLDVALLPYAL